MEVTRFLRQLEKQLASADFETERLSGSPPPAGAKGIEIGEALVVAVMSGTAEYLVRLCYEFARARVNLAKMRVIGPDDQSLVFPRDSIEAGYAIASGWKTYPMLRPNDGLGKRR
ncbi:MAG: hypothetical protein WD178_01630 [Actinomycetota bacterium]